jgi:hypothetical protein
MHGKSLSPVAEARIFAKKAAPRTLSHDGLIRPKRPYIGVSPSAKG